MPERTRLCRLRSIAQPHEITRRLAKSALAEATKAKALREAAEHEALAEVADLLEAWSARLSRGSFDPRLLLGAHAALEACETRRLRAAADADEARRDAAERAQALHLANARAEATAKTMRALRRRIERRREERRLAALADRTTLRWSEL
jgi:hypothetical protein